MIYFIILFLLYLLSEKIIKPSKDDSYLKKKIKTLIKIFIIMFCILNIYGFCLSNIIYSCILIYIISFIKDDDIVEFVKLINLNKETFISDYIDQEKSFSRIPAEYRSGNKNILKYNVNDQSYNNIENKEVHNDYNEDDLKKIRVVLNRKFWKLGEDDTYDMYENDNKIEEEEEIHAKDIYKGMCYFIQKLFSFLDIN